MDVLTFIVAVALVAGLASAMHGVIGPAVDWMYPPPAPEQPQALALPATPRQQAPRKRTRDRVLLVLLAAGIVGAVFMGFGVI